MIDPHVLQGGASSWLRIAANSDVFLAGAAAAAAVGTDGETGGIVAAAAGGSAAAGTAGSSRRFTPARNCASGDRNFVAIQRKM